MNYDKLNEHLAVKVMGWEWPDESYVGWVPDEIAPMERWQPHKNIEQAMMVLDTFEQWGISRNLVDKGYFVSIVDWYEGAPDEDWEGENESLPLAICIAAAKATGYSDD